MKKKRFLELEAVDAEVIDERVVDEEKNEKELDVLVKFQQADKVNSNGRLYPRSILQREIDKVNTRIQKGDSVWGHAFHPADGFGKPTDITHEWKEAWLEKDGSAMGKLTILPTQHGKTLQVLVLKGRLGISSRGFGDTVQKEKEIDGVKTKYLEIQDDYRMETPGDWVVAPSVSGAGNIREQLLLLESQLNEADEDKKENEEEEMDEKEHQELANKILIDHYNMYQSLDYKGSYETFVANHGRRILESQGLLGKEEKQKEKKKPVHYTASMLAREAKVMGLDPKEYASRLNEMEQRKAKEKELCPDDEKRAQILRSSHIAGMNISDPATRLKVLKEWQRPLPKKRLTEAEARAEEEKKRKIKEASKATFFHRERQLAGPPRPKTLEQRVSEVVKKLTPLIAKELEKTGE